MNEFLNNLNDIIAEARYNEKNDNEIIEVINTYRDVKKKKMDTNFWDESFLKVQKGAILMFMVFGVGMMTLCVLILVLLAIERNTRPQV